MPRVHIGDHWVIVSDEYLAKEREYCQKELKAFSVALRKASINNPDERDATVEQARQNVLDRRVEFWRKWNDTIPNNN